MVLRGIRRAPAACRVVFDGQSLVNNPDWIGEFVGPTFIGWCWPRLAVADLGLPGYVQPAQGGQSFTTLLSSFATRAGPWIAPASLEPTIYVLCGGTQDVLDGDTGAQIYTDAGALADAARTAGAQYVVCTTVFPSTGFSGAQNTQRLAANAAILADASNKFDAQINFEVSGLDNPADTASYLDGTHIYGYRSDPAHGTGRAAAIAAPVIATAVASVT